MKQFPQTTLKKHRQRLFALSVLAFLPYASAQPTEAPANPVVTQAPSASTIADNWLQDVSRFGFASKVRGNSLFYFGSIHLENHIKALKATQYWKQVGAFLEDQEPAPTAGSSSLSEQFKEFWSKDLFLSSAAGTVELLRELRAINNLQTQNSIQTLLAGGGSVPTEEGAPSLFNSTELDALLQNPNAVAELQEIVKRVEMPAILAGYKVDDAPKILETLLSEKNRKTLEKNKFKFGELTNKQGTIFTTAAWNASSELTEEKITKLVETHSKGQSDTYRSQIRSILENLSKKVVQLAVAQQDGFILLATYQQPSDLDFADSPSTSILGRPELSELAPHLKENLITLAYASKEVFSASISEVPSKPLVDGVLKALNSTETFAPIAKKVQGPAKEFLEVDRKLNEYTYTNYVGVSWWDKGLHAESAGGSNYPMFDLEKPLKYAHLLKQPNLFLGYNGHTRPEFSVTLSHWLGSLGQLSYLLSKELANTGLLGEGASQQVAMSEMLVMPMWMKLYGSLKDLFLKGTDTEVFFGVDLQGKKEFGEKPEETGFPRIFGVYAVKDIEQVRNSWGEVDQTLTGVLAMFGGGAEGGILGKPDTDEVHGFTRWHYPSAFLQGDLLPNSILSAEHLVLSTSKSASSLLAKNLSQSSGSKEAGAVFQLNVQYLSDFIDSANAMKPAKSNEETKTNAKDDEDADAVEETSTAAEIVEIASQSAARWLAPFHLLEIKVQQGPTSPKIKLDWEIKDVKSFD